MLRLTVILVFSIVFIGWAPALLARPLLALFCNDFAAALSQSLMVQVWGEREPRVLAAIVDLEGH